MAAVVPAIAGAHHSLNDQTALEPGVGAAQMGPGRRHLPATRRNVELVGRLRLAPVVRGRIGDVGVHGRYAYLAAFSEPRCRRGGVYIVDIANPAHPRQIGFLHAANDSFVGEGVQVRTIRTRYFKGDLLVHNNEICGRAKAAQGGISLYDVTHPARPRRLAAGVGDRTVPGAMRGPRAHQVHSAFVWQDGARAYAVMVDDEEVDDVDIMDITNPRRPRLVSETNLNRLGVGQPEVHGQASFLHDMVVKEIAGRQTMLASYWDGGYVQVNVDDPSRPRVVRDTDFRASDPQRAARRHTISPEGNGHQAEFDRTNRWFLAADEDFEAFRLTAQLTSGPEAGREFPVLQGVASSPVQTGRIKSEERDDPARFGAKRRRLVGSTAFVGLACGPGSVPPASSLGVEIAVVERGICFFTDKARAVDAAGYKGLVIFNRSGPDGGCDNVIGIVVDTPIPAVFVARSEGLRILRSFNPATYTCTDTAEVPTDTRAPEVGTLGEGIGIRATFDGWGYVHLFERRSGRQVDTYAIPEAQRLEFASGYGDLSVHEVATDPDADLAYLSYYAGGLRVVSFGPRGIREVGRYIHPAGNNFWGVEVLKHPDGGKYVVASDRDSGLWIFRYTGPRP